MFCKIARVMLKCESDTLSSRFMRTAYLYILSQYCCYAHQNAMWANDYIYQVMLANS